MLVCQKFNSDPEDYRSFKRNHGVKIIELTSDGEMLNMYELITHSDKYELDESDFL